MKTSILLLSTAIGSVAAFAPAQSTSRASTSLAFFGGAKKAAVKSSPLTEEAIEIYTTKYTGEARGKYFFESWGMPESFTNRPNNDVNIFERKQDELKSVFNTIASLYGEEEALEMVKIQPGVLAFNKDNMAPSLAAFGENFGEEEAKAMVLRNPGLLSVKPDSAESADGLTMQLSYVVDITRPIGALGPAFIIALLCIPALEGATGVSRGELFSSLF